MPRVLVAADAHIDHGVHGLDASAAWRNFCGHAAFGEYDLVVLAGDWFHTGNPRGWAVEMAVRGIAELAAAGVPILGVLGNHEWIGAQGSKTAAHALAGIVGVTVADTPRWVRYDTLSVAAIPWPRPGEQLASQVEAAARLADTAPDGPRLAVAHSMVAGSSFGGIRAGSEAEMVLQSASSVPLAALDLPAFTLTVCGHIHRGQWLSGTACYVGSTEAATFTDEGDPVKGVLSCEWDDTADRWQAEWLRTGVRTFLTLTANGARDLLDSGGGGANTVFRLRFDGSEPDGEADRLTAGLRATGAVVTTAPQADAAAGPLDEFDDPPFAADFDYTLQDLFGRWLQTQPEPEPEVRARAFALLDNVHLGHGD